MDQETVHAIWRAKWKADLVLVVGWGILCWILRPNAYVAVLTLIETQAAFWLCYVLLIRLPYRRFFRRRTPSEPS